MPHGRLGGCGTALPRRHGPSDKCTTVPFTDGKPEANGLRRAVDRLGPRYRHPGEARMPAEFPADK